MIVGELYKLTFANGKAYIGITKHSAEKRFKGHKQNARGPEQTILYRAWRKYGDPRCETLAEMEDHLLHAAEVAAIKKHRTQIPYGYNTTEGGEVSPMLNPFVAAKVAERLRSAEVKAKVAATRAARPKVKRVGHKWSEEEKARMRDRRHSNESKAKMSASALGRMITTEAKIKMSLAKLGKKMSAETKAKMSAAQLGHKRGLGKKLSKEHAARISESNRGAKRDDVVKAKMRLAQTKRYTDSPVSEETRARMSASARNRHAI